MCVSSDGMVDYMKQPQLLSGRGYYYFYYCENLPKATKSQFQEKQSRSREMRNSGNTGQLELRPLEWHTITAVFLIFLCIMYVLYVCGVAYVCVDYV